MLRKVASAWNKLVVGPLKYRAGEGYDAQRYWGDRLNKYGRSLRGPGHEGKSEQENRAAYARAGRDLLDLLDEQGVDPASARVLEVGVGTGFYSSLMRDNGVKNYLGIDITDVLFDELRSQHPGFGFERMDISEAAPEGEFDLVLMMDVVEHIVEQERFDAAMRHLRQVLVPRGVVVISGLQTERAKRLFYVRAWSVEDVRPHFDDGEMTGPVNFRDNLLVIFRCPQAT